MKVYVYARKFASALIQVEDNREQLASELLAVSSNWSQLNDYIPMYISDEVKNERLNQLGVMPTTRRLILELSRSGMMRLLPRITEQYIQMKNEANNKLVAQVTTKRSLSQQEQDMLSDVLHTRHQKEVILDQHVDANVIDGLKVEIDYHVFDDTVATKLDLIVQKLSYEMEVV
ncbi:MAG: ATP synthase F1 subunit delta [Culicoidibacterales bacterium]